MLLILYVSPNVFFIVQTSSLLFLMLLIWLTSRVLYRLVEFRAQGGLDMPVNEPLERMTPVRHQGLAETAFRYMAVSLYMTLCTKDMV